MENSLEDSTEYTGKSEVSFAAAAEDAAHKVPVPANVAPDSVDRYIVEGTEVNIRHQSPGHVTEYFVTLKRKPAG